MNPEEVFDRGNWIRVYLAGRWTIGTYHGPTGTPGLYAVESRDDELIWIVPASAMDFLTAHHPNPDISATNDPNGEASQ